MHSFALKKTAFAVLIALGAGVALAADNLTVGTGESKTDESEATYGVVTVQGTYINTKGNSVTADSVTSSGSFTNNGTFTADSFEVSGGTFANSGTLNTKTLFLSSAPTNAVVGSISATESMTILLSGYSNDVAEDLVLATPELKLVDNGPQAGLIFTKQNQVSMIEVVNVISKGHKTGLVVGSNSDLTFKTVNLIHTATGNDARVEVDSNGHVTIDTLTVSGTKGMVQTNDGSSATLNKIVVGANSTLNLQTYSPSGKEGNAGTFNIADVLVEDGGKFRLSVYNSDDGTPNGKVKADNISITLGAGAVADLGGWTNADWDPERVSVEADSLTVNVTDTSASVYLSGAKGNTNIGSLSVVASKDNNSGDAEQDLKKLSEVVKTNVKVDGTNKSDKVTAETIANITLTQEANDIFDGATTTVDENGDITTIRSTGNDNIDGIVGTASTGFLLWRDEMTSLNRRLDDLRDSSAHSNGLWARAYNSRSDYSARNVTSKYTAIQVGYDRQIVDRFWLGGAFSYTDGEHELAAGSADNSLAAFTLYGTWMHENGLFVDVTGKYGRIDNEFDISIGGDLSEGDYDTNAWGISVQAGWRWQPNQFFVEPQVELMYGRMSSVDYTTSTGMHVDHDAVDSLIGRAGVRVGVDYPENRGRVYLRASVLHDWQGEAEYNFTKGGDYRHEIDDLSGTWYEVGIGANFNVTDNLHFIGDLQTSQGGEVDTDYRINFVARYSF